MIFYPIKGYNSYCGPAAIAAILGITTDEAAKRVRANNPKKQKVRGLGNSDLLRVLEQAGWRPIYLPPFSRSVVTLLKQYKEYQEGMYLVNITSHYIVARRRQHTLGQQAGSCWQFVDNHHKTATPLASEHKWKTKRIKKMWFLVPPLSLTSSTPAANTEERSERLAAQRRTLSDDPLGLREIFRV